MKKSKKITNQDPRRWSMVFLVALIVIMVIVLGAFVIVNNQHRNKLRRGTQSSIPTTMQIDGWDVTFQQPASPLEVSITPKNGSIDVMEVSVPALAELGCDCDTSLVVGELRRFCGSEERQIDCSLASESGNIECDVDKSGFQVADCTITYQALTRQHTCKANCQTNSRFSNLTADQVMAEAEKAGQAVFDSLKINNR